MTSCGRVLLESHPSTFDYELRIDDGTRALRVRCHRAVLAAHAVRLRELSTGENFSDLTLRIKPGFLDSLLELLRFFYLHPSPARWRRPEEIRELATWLGCEASVWDAIWSDAVAPVVMHHNPVPSVTIDPVPSVLADHVPAPVVVSPKKRSAPKEKRVSVVCTRRRLRPRPIK